MKHKYSLSNLIMPGSDADKSQTEMLDKSKAVPGSSKNSSSNYSALMMGGGAPSQ